MAVVLGSTNATQGADFSTTMSGLLNQRQLVNNAGVFSLVSIDATTGTLTARGADLTPGVKTVVIETADGTSSTTRTRTSFDITVGAATAPVVPVIVLAVSAAGSAAVVVTVAAAGVPSGTTYQLIDARSQFQIDETDYGLTFNPSTGGLTGTLQPGTGLYDIVIVGFKNNVEVVRSRRFSVYAYGTVVGTPTPTPTPSPTLSLSSAVTQTEGNTGTATFVWTLTLNRDGSTAAYPFSWVVAGNGSNPAAAADFGGTYPTGSGTFATGETSKTITVLVTGDTAVEPDETFLLTVTASGLNTVTSTGTITNDDVTPTPPASNVGAFWSAIA